MFSEHTHLQSVAGRQISKARKLSMCRFVAREAILSKCTRRWSTTLHQTASQWRTAITSTSSKGGGGGYLVLMCGLLLLVFFLLFFLIAGIMFPWPIFWLSSLYAVFVFSLSLPISLSLSLSLSPTLSLSLSALSLSLSSLSLSLSLSLILSLSLSFSLSFTHSLFLSLPLSLSLSPLFLSLSLPPLSLCLLSLFHTLSLSLSLRSLSPPLSLSLSSLSLSFSDGPVPTPIHVTMPAKVWQAPTVTTSSLSVTRSIRREHLNRSSLATGAQTIHSTLAERRFLAWTRLTWTHLLSCVPVRLSVLFGTLLNSSIHKKASMWHGVHVQFVLWNCA